MASRLNPDLPSLLAGLTRELSGRHLPFMVIGGQAVLLHGRPRVTEDIDLTLGAGPDRLTDILALCGTLHLDPLPDNPERFVRDTFVLPVRDSGMGLRVDFIFSTTPYEQQAIARAVMVPNAGIPVPFAAAEDLLIHKLFAGRPRDLEDAVGVVRRKGKELDWGYLERWIGEFGVIPGREDLPEKLLALRRMVG